MRQRYYNYLEFLEGHRHQSILKGSFALEGFVEGCLAVSNVDEIHVFDLSRKSEDIASSKLESVDLYGGCYFKKKIHTIGKYIYVGLCIIQCGFAHVHPRYFQHALKISEMSQRILGK